MCVLVLYEKSPRGRGLGKMFLIRFFKKIIVFLHFLAKCDSNVGFKKRK